MFLRALIFLALLLPAFARSAELLTFPDDAAVDITMPIPMSPSLPPPPDPMLLPKPPPEEFRRWSVLLPAFVVHGEDPINGVNDHMPRRLDPNGRSVATPGLGVEFQALNSFDALVAYIRDCYDHPAGTAQIGQHFHWGPAFDFGYTAGLYVRQTPISCLISTVTQTWGGVGGTPLHTNTFSHTRCQFEDNFPWRYTFKWGDNYVDFIPTPFLNFSVRLYHGPVDVRVKFISNYYLNEVGLQIPF